MTVIGTIGTESNVSVGSLRDLSEFDVHMILPGVLIFGAVKCLKEVKSRF